MTLRMTDAEKKTARRLRRMGLTAQTARGWTSHAEQTDGGTLCVNRPRLFSGRSKRSVLDVLRHAAQLECRCGGKINQSSGECDGCNNAEVIQ